MKKLIPKPVRNALSPLVRQYTGYLARRSIRNRRITPPGNEVIALSYAGMAPLPGQPVSGGRVKLAHLNEVYPEQQNEFNILYLVSSALPANADEWVAACKQAGVKIVWNQNGVGYPAWAGEGYEAVNEPLRRLIHQADWVVYQSAFCKVSADKFLGPFKGPHSIIYNCVDTSLFTPALADLPESPVRLLVMGSHNQAYRVITPLETLALLLKRGVDARLTIAGRLGWSNAENEAQGKINSLGLREYVNVFGPYLQKEAPALYREAHILLHPKYNDACPTVPIEAMACGVPVLGSGSGGVPELLGDSGGTAINCPRSWDNVYVAGPDIIADEVICMMKDWKHLRSTANKRAVENFGKEKWVAEHQLVFARLLHG